MNDLWRLSATDLAGLIRDRKVSAREAATAGLARLDAVNPAINAVVDHRPGRSAGAGRCHRCGDCARRRCRAARRRAGHRQGQYRLRDLCRPRTASRSRTRSSPRTNSPVIDNLLQGRRGHPRPHQLPGILLSLVHHQPALWRHQKPARSRADAGRLVRRRRQRGRGRHRPYRPRHRYRRLDPLSRLCLRRARPAADRRPHRRL